MYGLGEAKKDQIKASFGLGVVWFCADSKDLAASEL
jgi:hypothetical protein